MIDVVYSGSYLGNAVQCGVVEAGSRNEALVASASGKDGLFSVKIIMDKDCNRH